MSLKNLPIAEPIEDPVSTIGASAPTEPPNPMVSVLAINELQVLCDFRWLFFLEIANNILLVMSETYTKHINPKDFANRSIFGDGAAATIVEKSNDEHIFEFILGTDGKGMNNLIIPNGGMRNRFNPNAELKKELPCCLTR